MAWPPLTMHDLSHSNNNLCNSLNTNENCDQVYVLPSFLLQRWEQKNYSGWMYQKVLMAMFRWIMRPINVSNSHWMLLVADSTTRTDGICDSLNSSHNAQYTTMWCAYMNARSKVAKEELPDWSHVEQTSPRQTATSIVCWNWYWY